MKKLLIVFSLIAIVFTFAICRSSEARCGFGMMECSSYYYTYCCPAFTGQTCSYLIDYNRCVQKSSCPCILEAIYSEHSEEVEFLRSFRDDVLSKTPSGQELIKLYYQLSPAIVSLIERNEALREKLIRIYYQFSPTIIEMLDEDESFRIGLIILYYQWGGPALVKAVEDDEIFSEEVKEIIDVILPMIGENLE